MVEFGKAETAKKKSYAAKGHTKLCDVNVYDIGISNLVKTKTNSKYLISHSDKAIKPLVLNMPKMTGYVNTLK